jgi:hypothetical protein
MATLGQPRKSLPRNQAFTMQRVVCKHSGSGRDEDAQPWR